MADPIYRIVLIPRLPTKPRLDVLFHTPKGFGVQVTDADAQALKAQGIPLVELYASADEYSGAVLGKSRQDALAALQTVTDPAIAALDPGDRDQFSVA